MLEESEKKDTKRYIILGPVVGSNIRITAHERFRDAFQQRFVVYPDGSLGIFILEGVQATRLAKVDWPWVQKPQRSAVIDFKSDEWLDTAKRLVDAAAAQAKAASSD